MIKDRSVMSDEADYQGLARTLVNLYGEGALRYVHRNSKMLQPDNTGQSESWLRVVRNVERLVSMNQRRRRTDEV